MLEDPDEYQNVSSSTGKVQQKSEQQGSADETAIELPELTTESYEDDPEVRSSATDISSPPGGFSHMPYRQGSQLKRESLYAYYPTESRYIWRRLFTVIHVLASPPLHNILLELPSCQARVPISAYLCKIRL